MASAFNRILLVAASSTAGRALVPAQDPPPDAGAADKGYDDFITDFEPSQPLNETIKDAAPGGEEGGPQERVLG